MGKITILNETTKDPISLIGRMSGVCYGSDTEDAEKNYKRGIENLESQHGRTFEYPQVYIVIDGFSARVIRELYTHIGGMPTRLQASTRYIDYTNFGYIIPDSIKENEKAADVYDYAMSTISACAEELKNLGIKKEDIANILPLGMETTVVLRTNLRNLMDMSHQRLCARAYWEYRKLMKMIMTGLSEYSDEWKYLIDNYFVPKCKVIGYCPERRSCGLTPKKKS